MSESSCTRDPLDPTTDTSRKTLLVTSFSFTKTDRPSSHGLHPSPNGFQSSHSPHVSPRAKTRTRAPTPRGQGLGEKPDAPSANATTTFSNRMARPRAPASSSGSQDGLVSMHVHMSNIYLNFKYRGNLLPPYSYNVMYSYSNYSHM